LASQLAETQPDARQDLADGFDRWNDPIRRGLAINLPDVVGTRLSDYGDPTCPHRRNGNRTAKPSIAWRSCDTPRK
ncbi:hypothetical protein AB0N87_44165, partial [Streptomyces sp. NPDC093228]